jgi:hypothetical protein
MVPVQVLVPVSVLVPVLVLVQERVPEFHLVAQIL